MKTFNLGEAKTRLSELVRDIRLGNEPTIVIALDGVPAACLVPMGAAPERVLGIDAGLVTITDEFDAADTEIALLFDRR